MQTLCLLFSSKPNGKLTMFWICFNFSFLMDDSRFGLEKRKQAVFFLTFRSLDLCVSLTVSSEPVSSLSPFIAPRNDFLLLKSLHPPRCRNPHPSSRVPTPLPPSLRDHALVQVLEVDDVLPGLPSSSHLSRLRLRAFMKKLLTVFSSSPSCCEMVSCISLDGRLFSLKMARSVLRCRSVKTSRDFFGVLLLSLLGSCSFLLHASGVSFVRKETQEKENKHVRIDYTYVTFYIYAFGKHLHPITLK